MGRRLSVRRSRQIPVYRETEVPSGYVGTVRAWREIGTVKADAQDGDLTVEHHETGEDTTHCKTLYITPPDADIRAGDGVIALLETGEPQYRVKTILRYADHAVAVVHAEKEA